MKKKIFIATGLLLVTLLTYSFHYDPNAWTKCITNGTGMNGEDVPNNYFCNSFEGEYNGEETILSQCETSGVGDAGGCSGNALGFYPAFY